MAEILSQEEVNALLESISKGPSKEGKKGEEKEKINPGAESPEYLEQREKVMTLLHNFYQERQKNLPVHREIGELAEKIKSFLEKANVYRDRFFKTKSYVKENDYNPKNQRSEYLIYFSKENETKEYWQDPIENTIPELQKILNQAEINESEKQELTALIQNLKNAVLEMNEKVGKLWEIRENIAKEFILIFPKFADFKDAKFSMRNQYNGLYNLDSEIWADKIFDTEKGREEKHIYFELNTFLRYDIFRNLEQKFNITEKEWKNIEALEWSGEEKENLKNLMEDVGEYRAEAEKLKEGLLMSANLKFKKEGANLVKDEFMRAFIRQLYEDYKLPIVHKERVVQEIMNGTFSF